MLGERSIDRNSRDRDIIIWLTVTFFFSFFIAVSLKRWKGRRSTRQTWTKCTEVVCTACTRPAVKHPWPHLISRASRTFKARTTLTGRTIQRLTWGYTLTRDTISRKATAPWCRGMVVSRKLQGINRITLKKDLYVTETCWRDAGYRMRKINIKISSFLPFFFFFFTHRSKNYYMTSLIGSSPSCNLKLVTFKFERWNK